MAISLPLIAAAAAWLPSCSPPARCRPPRLSGATSSASEYNIRIADLSDRSDALAICAVRKPTNYVVEDGSTGFLGRKTVITDPEEAYRRRVAARLGTAIDDNATVIIALLPRTEEPEVVGTCDCIDLPVGHRPCRAVGPKLPRRLLLRNLWVAEDHRRQGLARRLMEQASELAHSRGVAMLALEVLANNEPAVSLYQSMGFREIDDSPGGFKLPDWMGSMRGSLVLVKDL